MIVYYITTPNILYGIAAYCFAHYQRFNEAGKECAEVQLYRGRYLLAEVIIFWTTFFIMSFPWCFMICMGKERVENAFNANDEEDEEGEGKKSDGKDNKD